jgi:hypothetical protein
MTAALRHYCRNPRCRSKLVEPAENTHAAFCAKGCYEQYHRRRCIVCEAEFKRNAGNQLTCGRRRCRSEVRKWPALYRPFHHGPVSGPQTVKLSSETPILQGSKPAPASVRGWRWVRRAGDDDDWNLIGRDDKPLACIRQEGSGYWLADPKVVPEPPIEDLDRAKARAVSMALSALPTKMPAQSASPYGQPGREYVATGYLSAWRPTADGNDMPELPTFLLRKRTSLPHA